MREENNEQETNEQAVNETSENQALRTPAEMEPSGRKTGSVASKTFQLQGKVYKKGEEIRGLKKEEIERLDELGFIEGK